MKDFDNSKMQGNAGVGSAINYFTQEGYTVSIPLTDSQDYDLLIDDNGSIKKVQVKTSIHSRRAPGFVVGLRTNGGNRSGSGKMKTPDEMDYDILFVLTGDNRRFVIPDDEIDAKHSKEG